ncbi:RNA-binding protein [Anaerococcus sp.]|uniref:RNA-binding protein n=1 Tax=Anaerococcus sp. TaxID=1872515 RepID=UPI0027BA41BB|nr:RNA-binding protein [Anaerococcus sp.]
MKIKNKVVLAGLLLSLSLASCNNMSENKNTADDSKNETEVTESADTKETEEKADDKEASDKEESADNEKTEDKDAKEDKEDSEGPQTKEEAIDELEQAVFDSRVTMRALEILQTEAPEAIEGKEDEIQALIDRSNEVIERGREILDQVQNN